MFLFLAQTSAVGHSTARSLTVKEGWHGPGGGVGPGYVSDSEEEGDDNESDGDELDNVSRLHVHGVCVSSAVLDNIRKDKFHFRIQMVAVVISNVHWRVTWMNGRFQNQLLYRYQLNQTLVPKPKMLHVQTVTVAGVIPAWMMFQCV